MTKPFLITGSSKSGGTEISGKYSFNQLILNPISMKE